MANVISLQRRQRRQRKREGDTLCRAGRHNWEVVSDSRFDVKRGQLVTVTRCRRCGTERAEPR